MEFIGRTKNYIASHLPVSTEKRVLMGVAVIGALVFGYLFLVPKNGPQMKPVPLKCLVGARRQIPCQFNERKLPSELLEGLGGGFRKLGNAQPFLEGLGTGFRRFLPLA